VQRRNRTLQLLARASEQHDVIHVADVVDEMLVFAQSIHSAIDDRQHQSGEVRGDGAGTSGVINLSTFAEQG